MRKFTAGSLFPGWRKGEDGHAEIAVRQKLLADIELCSVLIDRGQRGVRPGEAVRMDVTCVIAIILRRNPRHVAIHAFLRMVGVIEGASALPGDAACLPVVVLVEAANPTVAVHRHIEVTFVPRRTTIPHLPTRTRVSR